MGTGADVAVESAGITLVKGDLNGIVRGRRLALATIRNKENFCDIMILPDPAGNLQHFYAQGESPKLLKISAILSAGSPVSI